MKPVVGTIDLVVKTTEGIRNTTTYWDPTIKPRRYPRHFDPNGILQPYNAEFALAQFLLRTVDRQVFVSHIYQFSSILQERQLLIVSNSALVVVQDFGEPTLSWWVSISDIKGVQLCEREIIIFLSRPVSNRMMETPTQIRVLRSTSRSPAELYHLIVQHIRVLRGVVNQ